MLPDHLKHLTFYLEVEDKMQDLIWDTLGVKELSEAESEQVFSIDDDVLFYEFKVLMNEIIRDVEPKLTSKPCLSERPFKEVEKEFLDLYYKMISLK